MPAVGAREEPALQDRDAHRLEIIFVNDLDVSHRVELGLFLRLPFDGKRAGHASVRAARSHKYWGRGRDAGDRLDPLDEAVRQVDAGLSRILVAGDLYGRDDQVLCVESSLYLDLCR